MQRSDYPIGRTDGLLTQAVADEVLVYDLNADKALSLNPTTAAVWRLCDGTNSVADISRQVSVSLQSPVSPSVVWMAVAQLRTMRLLANSDAFATPFDGLSRREMVKQIGLASAVALPMIFEVVAPTALHAQSVVCGPVGNCTSGGSTLCICLPPAPVGSNINPDGCPCLTNGDCSGNCQCGNPCTAPACPAGQTCQSGVCSGSGALCNGNCPLGVTCVTTPGDSAFGTCQGTCLPSPNNVCVGGTKRPICVPGDTSNRNPNCCPCNNVEGCLNCCNDGTCGPCIGL